MGGTVRTGTESSRDVRTRLSPVRTCVGCRSRDEQSALLRVVALHDESDTTRWRIAADDRRRTAGRGAYVHQDPQCLQLAITRRGFIRALRLPAKCQVDLSGIESRVRQIT